MKIIETNPNKQTDREASNAILTAKVLVEGKRGARHNNEHALTELHIDKGHNIYTTSITLAFSAKNLHGLQFAYFCNGNFWDTCSKTKVNLF
jgi:hypothetical protein